MKAPWKEILIALLVGLLVGWFAASKFATPGEGPRKGQMLERFSRELKLTPDQKEKVGKILELKREQITALRTEIRPQTDAIRNTAKLEIRKLLTPEQLESFNQLEAKWDVQRQKRRAKRF